MPMVGRLLAAAFPASHSSEARTTMRHLIAITALISLACAPAAARQGTGPTPAQGGQSATAEQRQGRPDQSGLKKFEDLTRGAVAREGFIDSYEKDGKLYLAVEPSMLGEQFLLSVQIGQGIGARGLFGGTMLEIFEGWVVSLERRGENVYLVRHPTRFMADDGTPMQRAVELSFGGSVLESAKIESIRPDSALVVDATSWFVSDLSNVGARVRNAVASRPGQPGRATLDKARSHLEAVKSFPENMNVRAKLTFSPGEPVNIQSVPDSRFIPVSIAYSLARLPAEPMKPRLADDRTGFFITARKDFSSTGVTFFSRYVNRWRLEPGERDGDLWIPKKPIIYYIDRTVPEEYRSYVMEGVNAWSKAFEAAGFRNAVRAELLPDDADPEDIRYPTIRWNTSDQPGYGAIGPSLVDPRTGEILDADMLFEAQMIQGFRNSSRRLFAPSDAVGALFTASDDALRGVAHDEMFGLMFEAQGELLRLAMLDRGELERGAAVPNEIVGQAVRWVTMHEVGHTLGLRHNFRSSTDTPLERLHDTDFTAERGVFSSVMEYPVVNIAPKGKVNGHYYNLGVGSADRWMIAYGYTPDDAKAAEIARQVAKEGHAFGTDEDARGPGALDPTVNVYDLSANPLAWGKERAALIASLIPTLPERVLQDNSRYAELTSALQLALGQYAQAVGTSVKYLGGQYQHRDHVGDPDGRPPFVNVPRSTQLEALDFLATAGFGERAFEVPREVLAQLGANRWSHWGESNTFNGRIDYPLHEQVLSAQRALLQQVLQPFVFARIRDAELKFGSSQVVTIPELMQRMTSSVWAEVWSGTPRSIRSTRRDLQRSHLDRMERFVIGGEERLPADARSVARANLVELKRRIDARLRSGGLDAYTGAHLSESSARIGKILDASLQVKTG